MLPSEFIALVILVAVIFYWIDTIRTKEIACMHGKQRCKDLGVIFLDETVEIRKLRLRRNKNGTVVFYREYWFEFSSDGVSRVDGEVIMLGTKLVELKMSAYPEPATPETESQPVSQSTVIDIETAKAKKNNTFPSGYR